jgi:hypothetical protein
MGRLELLGDLQVELLLVCACMGVCRLLHVPSMLPPGSGREGVADCDRHLHGALRQIVLGDGGVFGPPQGSLAALPLSRGPWGMVRGKDVLPYIYDFLVSGL